MARLKWFLQPIVPSWFKVCFITSCLEIWLSSPYISALSAQDDKITCSVPPVQLLQKTFLTCHFPEDISVTKKDFNVYHYNKGADSDAVLDCWWMSANMECIVLPGYAYNKTVNTELTVTLLNVTSSHTGIYACQVAGYPTNSFITCQFNAIHVNSPLETTLPGAETSQSDSPIVKPVLIGLSVGLTMTMLIVGVLLLLKRKRIIRSRMRRPRKNYEDGGDFSTSLIQSDAYLELKAKTNEFEEYLETTSRKMYPNILETLYFVPPVYFNKTEGSVQYVADQTVYVYTRPDRQNAIHDQAMQYLILCLRQVGEQKPEEMFVLTQFSFDDYLNNPCHDYEENLLPMPAGIDYNRDIVCFHFIIIHRHKGVLIGMVEVVNETCDESQFKSQKQDEIMAEVPHDIVRLEEACRVFKHLMSDQREFLEIRKVLILFNFIGSKEGRFKHVSENENIAFCYGRLPDADSVWSVDDHLARQLSSLLNSTTHETPDEARMSDDIYLKMISRFCGPATTSTLSVFFDSRPHILPKTLDQAVSMTGDFFERFTLYPGMKELLHEPLVCLVGPPCTGKTKMLTLAGKKWLSEGHDVHIKCSFEGGAISNQLQKIFESQPSNVGRVTLTHRLSKITSEKRLLIVYDELRFPKFEPSDNFFLRFLKGYANPLVTGSLAHYSEDGNRCWMATCSKTRINVPNFKTVFFDIPLSCPPAVLREENRCISVKSYNYFLHPPPTDGPPVLHIRHMGPGHFERAEPSDCVTCGNQILKFLTEVLHLVGAEQSFTIEETKTSVENQNVQSRIEPLPLKFSDLLLLFGNDIDNDTPMVNILVTAGIPVLVISQKKQLRAMMQEKNTALAANAKLLLGLKRKIVVFVEGMKRDDDANYIELRGITSCTSQLVLVHMV
ncbi:uncharacterized protein LOC112575780 isoform X2 [Pomacea canaliculata]|nr:uncharacterized protein LOC112575780 isoform X2 [Pomacea canaliculata]XP_025113587.1 uncharacterized protein LOC112575780 isoform X2 [Pomacea canaliculata]